MREHDLLTDLFETLRLSSLLSFVAELRVEDAVRVSAESRIVRFHLVRRGTCSIEVPGERPISLEREDLILIPHGASQTLRCAGVARSEPPVALDALLEAGALRDGVLRAGEGPVAASLLCGYCRFDPELEHPILDALPSTIVLRRGEDRVDPWIAAALGLLVLEADRSGPGTGAILTRVVEIVFVQAVRAMIAGGRGTGVDLDRPEDRRADDAFPARPAEGFLAALADRQLGRALAAIHRAPSERWTLTLLAREAGMSRAAFAHAFARRVGQPPITYLVRWRLTLARELLSRPGLSMDGIAERVGYASTAAFSRRFKDVYGVGPGAFRKEGAGRGDPER